MKVIGFFDVASVSEQRIFFNYIDVFPSMLQPDYPYECVIYEFDRTLGGPGCCGIEELISVVTTGNLIFYLRNEPIYYMVEPECGDCTSFSSNVIPDFWQD